MKEIKGKVAVVTGGGSGMGRAMAEAMAGEGCAVVVADIVLAQAQTVADAIKQAGGSAIAVRCDVSDRASMRAMKVAANEAYGPVSLFAANAGVTVFKRLTDMTDAEIDWVIDVDLMGVFNSIQVFLPDMLAAGEGHVVATSSFSGLIAPFIDAHAPYVAAKAGVIGLMMTMRRELAGSGVGMTVLCPGKVQTRITESFRYRPDRFGGPSDETVILPSAPDGPAGRNPGEVARMVLDAIRADRAVVVTDSTAREYFKKGYCDMIVSAFDDADRWDAAHGRA